MHRHLCPHDWGCCLQQGFEKFAWRLGDDEISDLAFDRNFVLCACWPDWNQTEKNQCSFLSECQYVHLSAIWAGCQGRIRTSKTLLKHLQCDTWMVWSRLLCSTAGGLSSSISAWSVFVSFSSNAQSLLKSVVFRTWLHEDSPIFSVYLINETQKPTPTLPHTILCTTLEANLIILNILGLKDELHTTSDSDSLLANLYIYIFTTTNRHQSSQTLSDSALLSTIGSTPFFRKTSKALLVAWPMPRSELRNSWRLTQSRWQECSTAFFLVTCECLLQVMILQLQSTASKWCYYY